MALAKRSRLHKVMLEFDDVGTYVNGEALFQEGAWDSDTQDWFGDAVAKEYPLTNMTPDGKKFLNDVLGVVATKALDAAETWKKELANTQAVNVDLKAKLEAAERDLKDALGARDNFAKLHKEAKGEVIAAKERAETYIQGWNAALAKLDKIPRFVRGLFGAT